MAFAHHRERVPHLSVADVVALGRQWVWLDWGRIAVAAVSFLASLRAFGLPFPAKSAPRDPLWVKFALGIFVALATAFLIYFVGDL